MARSTRLLSSIAFAAILAAATTGCKTASEVTGSIGSPVMATGGDPHQASEVWGERYRSNPRDPDTAINYARALRALGQRSQAVAVLEQASIANPSDMAVLGAYGRALADAGELKQALDVLSRSHKPDQPDWRILSVQGAVLDQMGQHKEAQRYYATALRITPNEPSVLSNLGLSYALSKDLARAEETLRRATAKPPVDVRVRQNLALIVGLRGRFAEAERIARADLPADEAAANVAYLKQMLAEPNGGLRGLSRPAQVSARKPQPSRASVRHAQADYTNRGRAENDNE